MTQGLTRTAVAMSFLATMGCVDKRSYETAPVLLSTDKGTIICQLYRADLTLWDEAISVPTGISIKTGDALCKQRGELLLRQAEHDE